MSKNDAIPEILSNPEFILGAHKSSQWPEDQGVEVAFAGRSNVGKSSAINAIVNRKKLARTSKTPGRTQQINFFRLNEHASLVDLPGYGFAQVPLAMKQHWEREIEYYLVERRCLRGLILLMDIRHPLTELDRQMVSWAGKTDINIHILLTKSDKFKRGKAANTVLQVKRELKNIPGKFSVQSFSSQNFDGVQIARNKLVELLTEY